MLRYPCGESMSPCQDFTCSSCREVASRVPKQSLIANTMDVPVYLLKLRLAGIYDPGERMD